MNKTDKIRDGQIQIDDERNYRPLPEPMAKETHNKVLRLITDLHREKHIDDMTRKWLSQTPNPPRIPEFYTLTKIHKPTITGRPIIFQQKEFPLLLIHYYNQYQKRRNLTLKIPPILQTRVKKRTFLVSMDVTSLYTNIPQNEGIEVVCKTYENFYKDNPPIPTHYLREMLRLILKENYFQFNGKHYLQTHGTAMGTKTAVSFANIFMAHIETAILSKSVLNLQSGNAT